MIVLTGILYILLPLVFAGLYFFGSLYAPSELLEPYNLSILAGAAAYVVFMSQFLLSARLRFLEKRVPQDRLLALHGLAGTAAASLVFIHGILKYVLVLRTGGATTQSLLGVFALIVSAVLTPLALLVLRGRRRNGGARRRSPRYNTNRIAHNLFALAGLAAVVHVYLVSRPEDLHPRLGAVQSRRLCLPQTDPSRETDRAETDGSGRAGTRHPSLRFRRQSAPVVRAVRLYQIHLNAAGRRGPSLHRILAG